MHLLRQGLLCGLGLASFVQHSASQNWDGPSPYPDGIAPDVIVEDGWNSPYPEFEGITTSYPALANGTDYLESEDASGIEKRDAKDFYLRILPLGASITQGVRSSDENGYRKLLRQQLRWKGWKVNMVGTKNNGNMADNDNEGHPGWIISQVHDEWSKSAVNGLKPNLVLINAGTNDCNGNIDTANAGARMKSLIDDIYNKLPDVTVVLSTLVRSRDHSTCSEDLSKQFRNLVKNDYAGKRIGMADIESVITMSQVSDDGIHPTDDGYRLFAGVWWSAISKLEGKIQPPPTDGLIKDDSAASSSKCPKVAGNASGPVQTQKGSGHDDGKYVHNRAERGAIESARIQKAGDDAAIWKSIPYNMYFADIIKNDPNSDRVLSLDDWIRVYDKQGGGRTYYFRQNLGGGKFGETKTFEPGLSCGSSTTSKIAFGDFNGDGLDDFFCLGDGSVKVALNRGGSPPKFESIGVVVPSVPNPLRVQIGDIDGDGRADFCIVEKDMSVKCSRNGGQGDKYSWQGFTTVDGLRGQVFGPLDPWSGPVEPAFHFGDINGDYRSDILIVGNNGNVQTWTNSRGRGSGIVPSWSSSGITHEGVVSGAEQYVNHQIKFGKIYGSNRLDYIYIKDQGDYFDVMVYENKGSGGTKLKADGTFYCDMRGTGSDDYVWIYADGHSTEIFANTHNPPFWDPNYKLTLQVNAPRTLIHLADWTGNGRCDVLVQDKTTSAVTLWENQWNSATKTLTFANRGVVASPGCGKSTGVSTFDRNMRIADMDGDGRADIVCFELEGKLTSWLNKKGGMENVGQIKKTEGWDRANIRLADVENSGRADIVWLNKYTGAGSVWKNNGYAGPNGGGGGSSFSWTQRGVLYSPIDRGEVMNFANLGGLGRADLVQLYPATNEAYTFFNKCPGGGAGGDDGNIGDPGLPVIDGGDVPDEDTDRYYYTPEDGPPGQGPTELASRNLLGTVLDKWYGCTSDQSNQIQRAYEDAMELLSQPQVSVPDWTQQITRDFFGAFSKVTGEQQSQIRSVFQNAATVTRGLPVVLQPFKWKLIIRCEERKEFSSCPQKLPDEPEGTCNPDGQPSTGQTMETATIAYTLNKPGSADQAEIMFCPRFFEKPSMKKAMDDAANLGDIEVNHLANYRSQADYFLHELFHTDLAANSVNNSPNPHILDVYLKYNSPILGSGKIPAYGTKWTKLLANYDNDIIADDFYNNAGFYTQRNAESYALFALSWYIQNKKGFYPSLPSYAGIAPGYRPIDKNGNYIRNPTYESNAAFRRRSKRQDPDWDHFRPRGFTLRHKDLLDALASKGAIVVTGSGNEQAPHVTSVPGIFGKPGLGSDHVPSLIVAGGVSADGVTSIYGAHEKAAGVPHIYAPAYDVYSVPEKQFWDGKTGLLTTKGTSCSAALTAGLAAYYIRLSQLGLIEAETSPQAIKDLIVRTSWSRKDVGEYPRSVIWNGADVMSPAREWTPNTLGGRALFARKFRA